MIAATVENAVRRSMSGSIASKDDVENVVKTYADVAREAQKKIIEETTSSQSSQVVIEKVVRKLDADKIEREKRRSNVVIMNVPESEMDSAGQKMLMTRNFAGQSLACLMMKL